MRIHTILHESFEDSGYIRIWAEGNGHPYSETHIYAGEKLPCPEEYDLLVVMGGLMNIYEDEKYPWLSEEKRYLKSAIDCGKNVLGICLGAQLIASVLGAEVTKNAAPEIGWFEVEKLSEGRNTALWSLIPDRFPSFHWHGDTFAIPDGATRLFTSAACNNQGFIYGGRVLGLQFHPEVMVENLHNLVENCPDDIAQCSASVQAVAEILDESRITSAHEIMVCILDYFNRIGN